MIDIIIWGTGSACKKRLLGLDFNNVNILAFTDNNSLKWGELFYDKLIIPPQKINEFNYRYILIASIYEDQIINDLRCMEVNENSIIPYNVPIFKLDLYKEIFNQKHLIINGFQELYKELYKTQFKFNYMDLDAYISSAEFIRKSFLDKKRIFESREEYYTYIIDKIKRKQGWKDLLFFEFGVFSGYTINFISNLIENVQIHGFDSFEGLPEKWRVGFNESTFNMSGNLPHVNDNVILHKGWFNVTIPEFISNVDSKCALIHIDCDLYSSTKTILDNLSNNIGTGTIIMFDEFIGFSGWQEDEYKAFNEFISKAKLKYDYIACVYAGQQVAIEIL